MSNRIVIICSLALVVGIRPLSLTPLCIRAAAAEADGTVAERTESPSVADSPALAPQALPDAASVEAHAEEADGAIEMLNAPEPPSDQTGHTHIDESGTSISFSDGGPDESSAHLSTQSLEPVVIDDILLDEEILELSTGAPGEEIIIDEVIVKDVKDVKEDGGYKVSFGDWVGYNATQTNTTWLAGGDFGMFSLESFPALKFGKDSAVRFGSGFHFLNGPSGSGVDSPDMPPRLFDLQMAFQARKAFSPKTMLDIRIGTGVFSDFEGSARKGVRFPSHLVAYHEHHHDFSTVFGADILDRDDISVLPVAGFICRPHEDLILECVFPRPRIQLRLNEKQTMYFGGELGGGTWAIERDLRFNDNATYRDIRLTWGITSFDDDDSTMEIGWATDRRLEYRSGLGDTNLDGAFILRWHKHY